MLDAVTVQCPTCWEAQELLIDSSVGDQDYTEDCTVCCRPMAVHVRCGSGEPRVEVEAE